MYVSRKEAVNLPVFKNHKEAIDYFKKRSGERFLVTYSREIFDPHTIYFCYLMLDGGNTQLIQIHEDGLVKIEF